MGSNIGDKITEAVNKARQEAKRLKGESKQVHEDLRREQAETHAEVGRSIGDAARSVKEKFTK